MAAMLELECPGCTGRLELDAGFAGGVCRCSLCGTLMTVPADPAHHRAERLSRPDSPGGRPDSPNGARPSAPPTPAPREQQPDAIDTPDDQPPPAPSAALPADQTGMETYVTDTGRIVRIESSSQIPTAAKKRVVVRAVTGVVFFAVVGIILALMGGAIWLMVRPVPPPDMSKIALQRFDFSRDANPWTMDAPNVLGFSLGPSAAVVVDASAASAAWLDDVKAAVASGLTRADSGAQVALIYATDSGVETLGSGLRAIGGLSRDGITRFQDRVQPRGSAALRPAIETAVERQPESVILIIGRRLEARDAEDILSLVQGSSVLLDVLAVDRDDPALERLARDTGGRYQFLARSTLEAWRAEAGN